LKYYVLKKTRCYTILYFPGILVFRHLSFWKEIERKNNIFFMQPQTPMSGDFWDNEDENVTHHIFLYIAVAMSVTSDNPGNNPPSLYVHRG
jgi:hypothetical protein